ncbi:unnamed protein product [Euphydryas editha]|uniref:Histone deacetylase complex subunit SAP30 Sin3 binding domain-containing protein n=1 Tax=Euphydryas editha TaxID=104508 RepID=A0AAU9V030_EUPED|nr:unnamed protein product [Euphydryas editha]
MERRLPRDGKGDGGRESTGGVDSKKMNQASKASCGNITKGNLVNSARSTKILEKNSEKVKRLKEKRPKEVSDLGDVNLLLVKSNTTKIQANSIIAKRNPFILTSTFQANSLHCIRAQVRVRIDLQNKPNLAHSDFFLFFDLKKDLRGRRFVDDKEMKAVVDRHFEEKDTECFLGGLKALYVRGETCISLEGDYIEK